MSGFGAMIGSLFGRRQETEEPSGDITALEQEFAGVTPIDLVQYDARPTGVPGSRGGAASEAAQAAPAFRLSKQAVEIVRAPGAWKAKGEELRAHFVFTPGAGPRKLIEVVNPQTEQEVQPGSPLRFTFPPEAQKHVFLDTGKGLIYIRGDNNRKSIYGVTVGWPIPDALRPIM